MKTVKVQLESSSWNTQMQLEKDLFKIKCNSTRKLYNLYLTELELPHMMVERINRDLRKTSDK
jgi:hypothetical protein